MTEHAAVPSSASPGVVAPARAPAPDEAPAVTHGFLFADLRDYTGYVEAHGDRAGAALLERYRALVRGIVAAARGAEIRTEGDSFYVVFGSVSAAVRAGLAIVDAAAATAAYPDPIRVGVGVHAGETVETSDGFVGSAVNIAARLCAEAKAGELVVSETVRGLVRTSLEVDFVLLGPRRLKGAVEPVACYRVVARGAAPAFTARARPSARGRRPWLLAAGVGLAAIAVIAGAVVLLGGGHAAAPAPTPDPSAAALASPSVAAAPSPAASAGGSSQPFAPTASPSLGPFPNAVEAAILNALPSTVAKTCRRGGTSEDASLAGFVGRNRVCATCTPEWDEVNPGDGLGGVTCLPTTGPARFYIMDLGGLDWGGGHFGAADETIGALEAKYQIPDGSCATTNPAHERWTSPLGTGLLACMNPSPYDGRPWIYFTFGKGRYLAFATRDNAADYDALYAWFDQLKTFLP